MISCPESTYLKQWSCFLQVIRSYFESRACLPVETPSLVDCPGTEPHLLPFATELQQGKSIQKKFLPTSPEMHMKKLLCEGVGDIFEIKKCYRNGEISKTHSPEFYLLEWYRVGWDLDKLKQEVMDLFQYINEKDLVKDQLGVFESRTVRQLFAEHLDFNLKPDTSVKELQELIKAHVVCEEIPQDFETCFHLLFLNKIEPCLDKNACFFIQDYPPQLRAFSKITKQGWADRLEVFWRGMELANAFNEVTSAEEMRKLFQSHLKDDKRNLDLDHELLQAMHAKGMPACSGIALGLDRLFAASLNQDNIWFFKNYSY